MERYYHPGGSIPRDGPAAWVTFAGPATSTPLDHDGNHVHGTPGGPNWAGTVTETPSPTATKTPIVCPSATYSSLSLLINEVGWMGTAASSSDEWIEFYNPSSKCINLSGWKLTSVANSNTNIRLSGIIMCGGYFVLADNDQVFQCPDNNQVFPCSSGGAFDYSQTQSLSLLNEGEDLELISPTDTIVDTADFWGGSWPAGIASSSDSNLAYSSMERNR